MCPVDHCRGTHHWTVSLFALPLDLVSLLGYSRSLLSPPGHTGISESSAHGTQTRRARRSDSSDQTNSFYQMWLLGIHATSSPKVLQRERSKGPLPSGFSSIFKVLPILEGLLPGSYFLPLSLFCSVCCKSPLAKRDNQTTPSRLHDLPKLQGPPSGLILNSVYPGFLVTSTDKVNMELKIFRKLHSLFLVCVCVCVQLFILVKSEYA